MNQVSIMNAATVSGSRAVRTSATPAVGPVRCASWCEEGDGHPTALYVEDQWCHSLGASVVLSLAEPWVQHDGSTSPAMGRVYANRDHGEAARVTVVDAQDRSMDLTPDEARELAGVLRHYAWVAEQDPRERNAFEIGRDLGRTRV